MLGDVRKMVHDAWEFFAPPLIYSSIAALFFWYVCGSAPLVRLTNQIVAGSNIFLSAEATALLERYRLTALVPIIALFLISVIAYLINRVVFGLANLLPFKLITSPGSIVESMVHTNPTWRKHLARYQSSSAGDLINYAIAKARVEKREELLSNLTSWQKDRGHAVQLFFFSKFLLVWTIACAALSLVLPDATPFTYRRVALLLILVISFGLISACRFAYAARQELLAELHTAKALLDSEVTGDQEEKTEHSSVVKQDLQRWEQLRNRPWWRIGLSPMEWSPMLRHYEYLSAELPQPNSNPWLQAVLRNNLNILWFILGAVMIGLLSKLSWWVGLLLFVGYVSVTIVDCLLVALMLAVTFGRALVVLIKNRIPGDFLDLVPNSLLSQIQPLGNERYWFTAAGVRGIEALVAIVLSRIMANYFF